MTGSDNEKVWESLVRKDRMDGQYSRITPIQEIWQSFSVADRWQCYNHNYRCLSWGMYSIEMRSTGKKYRCGCGESK